MKRLTVLLMAMLFALGSVSAAKADGIDIKVKGQWDFAFGWGTNGGWSQSVHGQRSASGNDDFIARQRVRTQINFIASENLQGVLMFEIGNLDWGGNNGNGRNGQGSGGSIDADGVNVETKRAYLDWMIPDTEISIRMGIQGFKLPSTRLGSGILDSEAGGVVVNTPINDMFSLSAFWIRPFNADLSDDDQNNRDDEMDLFGLILPVKGDGWEVTPWGMFGRVGSASGYYDYMYGGTKSVSSSSINGDLNDHAWMWMAGFNFELSMFDPLTFGFDALYGDLHKAEIGNNKVLSSGRYTMPLDTEVGTKGWFVAATLDYKLDFMTPGIFGWWSTGDDWDDVQEGQLGRAPVISTDTGWQATTFGALGSPNIATEGTVIGSATGTWGIGIQFAKMSFVEDLTHTLRVAYYRGTNDAEVVENGFVPATRGAMDMYLTDKDSVIEVNFDHEYQIYENLSALLELGYIHLSLDEDVWRDGGFAGREQDDSNHAWKAQLQFQYKF